MPRRRAVPHSRVGQDCRVADERLTRAFDLLGKRWTGVLLDILRGGPTGFRALSRGVSGISDSVLSDRLAELAQAGLVDRAVHEGPPLSVTYELTQAGRALLPALEQVGRWAARYLHSDEAAPAPLTSAPLSRVKA